MATTTTETRHCPSCNIAREITVYDPDHQWSDEEMLTCPSPFSDRAAQVVCTLCGRTTQHGKLSLPCEFHHQLSFDF